MNIEKIEEFERPVDFEVYKAMLVLHKLCEYNHNLYVDCTQCPIYNSREDSCSATTWNEGDNLVLFPRDWILKSPSDYNCFE